VSSCHEAAHLPTFFHIATKENVKPKKLIASFTNGERLLCFWWVTSTFRTTTIDANLNASSNHHISNCADVAGL
jgi:hypothetical protein